MKGEERVRPESDKRRFASTPIEGKNEKAEMTSRPMDDMSIIENKPMISNIVADEGVTQDRDPPTDYVWVPAGNPGDIMDISEGENEE